MNAADTTNTFNTEITMTDQSNPTPDPGERRLHDEAAELAELAVASLFDLAEEGIQQYAARLGMDLAPLIHAAWLITETIEAPLRLVLEEGDPETVRRYRDSGAIRALDLLAAASRVEALLSEALAHLRSLACESDGELLEAYLQGAMQGYADRREEIKDFFMGIYSDPNRAEKVHKLNALLHRDADGSDEEVQS